MAPDPVKYLSQEDHRLARIFPASEEDGIVISGMSGRFPNSRNVAEYEHQLYNKIDMVDEAETRWRHFNAEIPRRSGKMFDLERFDATFFGVHFKQAHTMDPQCRLLIECAYEAILDAGVNPKSLAGSRTGVYVGACISESEKTWFYDKACSGGFGITGCSRAMLANRISYILGLNGPSYLVDTACSSSMYALDNAFTAFRNGEIDAALVGGANLVLHPYVTLQFARLGVLAADGYCRPFDQDASGYTRSESVNCIFLQRKKDAKRIYASLIYSKTNCDGYKTEGITYPSGPMQEKLLREFYNNVDVHPNEIGYLEAHSTGTFVGDPEECRAIDNVLCSQRTKPLLVGSVKSNVGHSEAASGNNSVVKVILAFQNGKIAPNINFNKVKKEIPALVEGRLKVVTDVEELTSPYIGVNSFGFGGANAHALLRACEKEKVNFGVPKDNLPRLVTWSGRTEESVNALFNALESKPLDAEYVALLHSIQRNPIPGMVFRGYGLYCHEEGKNAQCIAKQVQHFTGIKRPIVWVFSGMGSQWTEMGTSLMHNPLFRQSIERCHRALEPKGLNLIDILTSTDKTTYDNILHSFVGIAAIQIAIVDILKALEIEPDYVIGHSVGELGCAYADGGFTAEQMILSSYSRGIVSVEMDKIRGSMAAVGLGYKDIVKILPAAIEVACHNGPDSSTISGPSEDVAKFVGELKSKGIFAKEVPCSNIAYHSRYISHMGPALLKRLKEVIPEPKQRSSKWLSSSVPKALWDQKDNQLCSAEYHTKNLLNSVLFEETSALLPSNSLTIEIAPHGLLQAILRKSMPNSVHIGLTQRSNNNNLSYFLEALGRIYLNGLHFPIESLYPAVQFPVSRGTPMISSTIKWDHSEEWYVTRFEYIKLDQSAEREISINMQSDNEEYLSGHVIDGKILVPASAYLLFAWETLSLMRYGPSFMDMPVDFEDVKFIRATPLLKDVTTNLTVMIHCGTGIFEITENGTLIVTGIVRELDNPQPPKPLPPLAPSDAPIVKSKDFYKELRLRGYHYNGGFRAVQEARSDGAWAKIKWDYNWVTFIDCMLQSHIIGFDSRNMLLPTRIRRMTVNGKYHHKLLSEMDPNNMAFEVQSSRKLGRVVSGGIEIIGLHASPVSRRRPPGIPILERYQFIPHFPSPKLEPADAVRTCVQLALENCPTLKMKIVEVDTEKSEQIITHFVDSLDDLPLVKGDYILLTEQELDLTGVFVDNKKLSTQLNCDIIIASNILSNEDFLTEAQKSLNEKAFLIAREKTNFNANELQAPIGFHTIAVLPTQGETFVFFQRLEKKFYGYPTVVYISEKDSEFDWVQRVQTAMAKGPVLLVAQNEKFNGLIGFVNCLRKEPEGDLIKCVFIDDPKAPPFDMELPFYKSQLKLGMAMNIFKDGKWGSYRHLQLKQEIVEQRHKHLVAGNTKVRGDLSSMAWFHGPINYDDCDTKVVYVSLNFRDVMLATGRLSVDLYGDCRAEQASVLGFEYAGYDKAGRRTMGMVLKGALASYNNTSKGNTWLIPKHLSFEEGATIPVVYSTVYYAFFFSTDIRRGKSILIHAGTGGVGLAAIRVALGYGLEVYTTCSSKEKRQYLLDTFPQIKESHIGNSRDTSFETMILEQTDGKGVDFVLNSLAEDKLLASVRCLAQRGHFLEIGKFDMANDTKLGLAPFLKELTFHAVLADNIFDLPAGFATTLLGMIDDDIERGIIKPLPVTVFKAYELEKAFRYLAGGKHIGKVIIQIRDDPTSEYTIPLKVIPQSYFDNNLVYIIPGGLGGFGLELADWMICRGARKVVLSSRKGITKQYQAYRIYLWETYGAKVVISTADITTKSGCERLIKEAMKLGPVGGIFNLAVNLQDAVFVNQTPSKFNQSLAPKACATIYLDELSRKLCPLLQHFVVFSSVSCGRGNAGQTNYGMANSVMERVVEDRVKQGLPGKAIQWGAVGEVGLVADMAEDKIDMEIGGTLQQRISSCLHELDTLLNTPDPIVASMVVAEKRTSNKGNGVVETVMHIMGIRDLKSISMGTSLAEMGMDSLMAVEIKQTLEREFELFLTPQDLRSLTFQRLQEISEVRESSTEPVKIRLANSNQAVGMGLLLRNLGDEANSDKTILSLMTKSNVSTGINPTIIIPGLEGTAGQAWYNIGTNLKAEAVVLQLFHTAEITSLEKIAEKLFENIQPILKPREPFFIVSYSYGSLVAIELARLLERVGMHGELLFIDGAPHFLRKLCSGHLANNFTDENILNVIFTVAIHRIFPDEDLEKVGAILSTARGWDEKINKLLEFSEQQNAYSKEYTISMMKAMFNRIKILTSLDIDKIEPINSPATLIRPSEVSVVDIDEDYELSKIVSGKISLKFIEGDHTTMLDNARLHQIINECTPGLKEDQFFEEYLQHLSKIKK